ncbi:hypothetical protein HMPREF1981_00266 [Bacteroides pyogenes F0041]|uniref:Transmembrane protein n=1 Tax=Bacteroides pyogenes F0041 TaxID=1321819 RepID=U2CE86_9BACE|nr:hypothetical protein HMPREF1981_00266 [Bacteroides pyogenes F0041]GAE23111.1 hypothetical protein JCM10003_2812 [Bacteroides pyogenes JCM 10003]
MEQEERSKKRQRNVGEENQEIVKITHLGIVCLFGILDLCILIIQTKKLTFNNRYGSELRRKV